MAEKEDKFTDALNKVHDALPALKLMDAEEIPVTPGILPWYIRKAWKFSLPDSSGHHIVVCLGGRSEQPGDVNYLTHIHWRKETECLFHSFQIDWETDAEKNMREILDWFSNVEPGKMASFGEDKKLEYVITKKPVRMCFECRGCGCEFNLPADQCERTSTTGCGGKFGGHMYTWLHAKCPCCGTLCTKELRTNQ